MAISVEANNESYPVLYINCLILVSDYQQIWIIRNIFTSVSTIKFHGYLFSGRRAHVPAYRRMHVKQTGFNSCHADLGETLT